MRSSFGTYNRSPRRRPHGQQSTTNVATTYTAQTFEDARKTAVGILEGLSFVKVVSVQQSGKGIYYGEAIEMRNDRPKLVFFDKLGRSRNLLQVGPIHVAQAPMGYEHASSVPTVGDILLGSLVPNTRKSHLELVLRGWTSDAKPLFELLRILRYGTRNSEFEVRQLLVQNTCNLMRCPADIKKCRDDIYMTARIILWGSVRPLQILACLKYPEEYALIEKATDIEIEQSKQILLSNDPITFLDLLTTKFQDSSIAEKFQKGLTILEQKQVALRNYMTPMEAMNQAFYSKPCTEPVLFQSVAFEGRSSTPTINLEESSYVPESPKYVPESPRYVPESPKYVPESPRYVPESPRYIPANNLDYVPTSPTQSKTLADYITSLQNPAMNK